MRKEDALCAGRNSDIKMFGNEEVEEKFFEK
jgi:hypothetical protein